MPGAGEIGAGEICAGDTAGEAGAVLIPGPGGGDAPDVAIGDPGDDCTDGPGDASGDGSGVDSPFGVGGSGSGGEFVGTSDAWLPVNRGGEPAVGGNCVPLCEGTGAGCAERGLVAGLDEEAFGVPGVFAGDAGDVLAPDGNRGKALPGGA